MKSFFAKLGRKNGIAKRIFSMALAILMMTSTVQALPAGVLAAHAAESTTKKIHVTVPDNWSWGTPSVNVQGGDATTKVTSDGTTEITGVSITGWGATDKAYQLVEETALKTDCKSYYFYIEGTFTGFQFLDMEATDNSVKNGVYTSNVAHPNLTLTDASDLYFLCGTNNMWWSDAAMTQEITAPAGTITSFNVVMHYNNNTSTQWDAVAAYAWTSSGDVTASWPGNAMTANSSNSGWYDAESLQVTGNTLNFIFNNNNGGSQTGNLSLTATTETVEVWVDGATQAISTTAPEGWTTGSGGGNSESDVAQTNITINLGVPSTWGWSAPAMQYYDCSTVTLSGCGEAAEITGWSGAQGYTLTAAGEDTEAGIKWYTITLTGDLTGIGTQFLDMSNPSNNTAGSIFVKELLGDEYKSDSAINVYVTPIDGTWTWYKDQSLQTPVVEPSDLTQQTLTVHFNNSNNWSEVAAYMGMTGSFKAMTHNGSQVYAYTNSWPGAIVEADPDNTGWYSYKITTDPGEYAVIFNNNNNGSQTGNITYTPDKEETELWIYADGTVSDTAPSGWVTNTQTINPPVNPLADVSYDSPVVNSDGSITFNLADDGYTSAEVMGTVPSCSWTIGSGFAMTLSGDKWTYTTEAGIAPGVYSYKFVTNGSAWNTDKLCELTIDGNSGVIVPGLSNSEVAPEKGVATDLPKTLKLYTAGSTTATDVNVTYTLDDATLADVVTIDNTAYTITVDAACTETEFTLTASDGTNTSKLYVKPQDKIYTYTIYYYDFDDSHMATDAAQIWAWANDGQPITDANDFMKVETLSDGRGWLKTVIKTSSTDIGFKSRSYGGWSWESTNHAYQNTNETDNVTLYFIYSDASTYTTLPEFEEPRERYILVSYKRADGAYSNATSGWNFYSWNTGFGSETEIYGNMMNGEYVMKAPIKDSEVDYTLAFIIRNSEKATDGNKWLAQSGDTYVTIPADQDVVKIYFEDGKIVNTLPYNKSYEIDGANNKITFFYRDDSALALNNSAKLSETVQVIVNGTPYTMTYDAKNARYYYDYTGIETGDYTFSYKVGDREIQDKFASNGVVTYRAFDDLGISASLSQSSMDYNDNNVLSVEFTGADASSITTAEIVSITADLSPLGIDNDLEIAPELMEGTISADRSASTGQKTINVTVKDVYGNVYTTSVSVTITERDADAFDWDEAVIYMTCTDRFYDGNTSNNSGVNKEESLGYHGGDFAGLTQKLDYLKDLGVNTIWITPIVQNSNTSSDNGYHGYWASDFTQLSSYLGTETEFATLLNEAHARDMKIMVDVVLNHAGYGTESYFNGILSGTTMIRDADNTIAGDEIYSSLSDLPDFMTENEAVRNQLIDWQVDWMENYDIDYYRIDTVKHVDTLTWQAFKNELTKVNPDFKIIGEYYGAGYASTGGALGTGTMDSLLDFDVNNKALAFVTGSISSVEAFYTSRNNSISNSATLGGFLSSHDEDSFVDMLINQNSMTEEEALALAKVAASLQITAKGQVVIYYGEEIGQHGLNNWPIQSNRNDFDWEEAAAQNGVENSMLTHYQKLLDIRSEYSDVISMGTRTTIAANDASGYDVFKRTNGTEELIVALNIKDAEQSVTFRPGTADGTIYTDLYGGETYKVASGVVKVSLPAAADGGTVILVKTGYEQPPVSPTTPSTDTTTTETPSTSTNKGTTTTTEDTEVKVETEADEEVPENVDDVTPVVDNTLKAKVKSETVKLLEDIVNDEVAEGVLSKETLENVKEAQKDGEGIITEIIVEAIDEATVDSDVKQALEEALVSSVEGTETVKTEIAQYLDLSVLLKTLDGQELGKINKVSSPITFTIAIPEDMLQEGRTFVVLRMHEGEVTVLETTMNQDGTLSFETDRFSTYALAYIDAPVVEDAEDEAVTDDMAPTDSDTEDGGNGITTFIILLCIILAIVAALIIFLVLKNKKKE